MLSFSTLSSRLTVAMVAGGVTVLIANFWLVSSQLDGSLKHQASELEAISDHELANDLQADARLIAARLVVQADDIARRVAAISQDGQVHAAIASFNTTAIYAVLSEAAHTADIDSVIVFDAKMAPVGDSRNAIDLIHDAQLIDQTVLAAPVRNMIAKASLANPLQFSQNVVVTPQLRAIFGFGPDAQVMQAVVRPVYDDFGEVAAILVAARALRQTESILLAFSRITKAAAVVRVGGRIASTAGIDDPPPLLPPSDNTLLWRSADQSRIGACIDDLWVMQVCALKPMSELYSARDQLIRTGTAEGEGISKSLLGFGIGSVVMFAAIALGLARQITRPIARITSAVSKVAEGDYTIALPDTRRRDEVGGIARAVAVLRESMRERDQLRRDTAAQNNRLIAQDTALRLQNELFDAALNNMTHGLCMFDRDGRLIVYNRRFLDLYALSDEVIHQGITADAMRREKGRNLVAEDVIRRPNSVLDFEPDTTTLLHLQNGRIIEVSKEVIAHGGWLTIHEDVTDRKRNETKILQMATEDSLTGLANRYVLRQRIESELRKGPASSIALLCLDLDDFKLVNDTLGHPAGDQLLQVIAARLLTAVRPQDLVARLGGDEFAIVLDNVSDPIDATEHCIRIGAAIGQPIDIEGTSINTYTCIGGAIGPRDGSTADELLKRADLALYSAKALGKGHNCFFDPAMESSVRARQDLINDMIAGLERGEFEPYFQPQINLSSNRIVGFEALARWHHPTRGLVSPLEFIPTAEETGLIAQIGERILIQSCVIAAGWPVPLKIAVNVSPLQLKSSFFVDVVARALALTGLAADRLELEITESALLDENAETRAALLAIKALGVRISMDDFGTGYSSLSCLRNFPFDKIKIDQSFIRGRDERESSMAIVASVLEMARNLKIATTAEGVETAEVADALRAGGCDDAQGYLFGAPQNAKVTLGLIQRFFPAAAPMVPCAEQTVSAA